MILQAKEKEIELQFKSLKMEQLGDKLGKGDTKFKLQEAAYESNIRVLGLMIAHFSAEKLENIYSLIDDMLEDGKSIAEIYGKLFEGINERGFFTPPLETKTDTPPMNMKTIMNTFMEKMSVADVQSVNATGVNSSEAPDPLLMPVA